MATFEDIKQANESIKTIEIKNKEYAEVNQRIKAFRMVYPEGFIKTTMESNENGVCVFRAVVGFYDPTTPYLREVVLGTGTAFERQDASFINKTSYIENCETSAIGRALGMVGFGIDVSIASAEEVQNAILNQKKDEKITDVQLKSIKLTIKNNENVTEKGILEYFKIKKLEDMTTENLRTFMEMINGMEKENDKK